MRFEIHQQKREIAHGVDPGESGVELQRIEWGQVPVESHDIAAMKIAVALAERSSLVARALLFGKYRPGHSYPAVH